MEGGGKGLRGWWLWSGFYYQTCFESSEPSVPQSLTKLRRHEWRKVQMHKPTWSPLIPLSLTQSPPITPHPPHSLVLLPVWGNSINNCLIAHKQQCKLCTFCLQVRKISSSFVQKTRQQTHVPKRYLKFKKKIYLITFIVKLSFILMLHIFAYSCNHRDILSPHRAKYI